MFKKCPSCHKVIMKRARICVHCGYMFIELSPLNTTQDIMGAENQQGPQTQDNIVRMKVYKWFWKVYHSKKDGKAMLRADFYSSDLLQGPKLLFLKLLHPEPEKTWAYRKLKSLLQGVVIPPLNAINGARELHILADTINASFKPPLWIEYKQSGKYITITNWGWD